MITKTVYVSLSADVVHPSHLNILQRALELGEVTVGLLTDSAIASYKRAPLMTFEQRRQVVESLKPVSRVVPQATLDCIPNIQALKPDYVIYGDKWHLAVMEEMHKRLTDTLAEWRGQFVELPHTADLPLAPPDEVLRVIRGTPDIRRSMLRRLLHIKPIIRFLDTHNALTGLIIENTSVPTAFGNREFDGMWASSLTNSTAKGKPDIELLDFSTRLNALNEVLEVTTKPVIYDGDTGGKIEHFTYTVRTLERIGVSAVIIEDKTGSKKNSLFGTAVEQTQDSIENFCYKIQSGKRAQRTDDFMIIARVESLILEKGMSDAMTRASAYLDAGADGIMIHSHRESSSEILEFCRHYDRLPNRKPLVVAPSTYYAVTEDDLSAAGVGIVIYANHMLRSAYPAMIQTAQSILQYGHSAECNDRLMPISEILRLIPQSYP